MGALFSRVDSKYTELLAYVVRFEETSRLADESFVGPYTGDLDWKDDHFLRRAILRRALPRRAAETRENDGDHDGDNLNTRGGKGDEHDVFIDSYIVDSWKEKLGVEASKELFFVNEGNGVNPKQSGTFSKAPSPLMSFSVLPEKSEISENILRELENLRKANQEEFGDSELRDILNSKRLTLENVPTEDVEPRGKDSLAYAIVNRELTSLRQRLVELDQKTSKLVLGFCHVRLRYTDKKEGRKMIVNGPLFEIPIEVKKQGNKMCVEPCSDAEVRLNRAVLSVVLDSIGATTETYKEVNSLTKSMEVKSLFPGKSETFFDVAQKVNYHHWNTLLKKISDEDVHEPPADMNTLVITDAWCMFCREKKTSVFEDDAYALLKAAKDGERKMVPGIIAMTKGPPTSHQVRQILPWKAPANDLIFPLPTSERQKQIAYQLFVSNVPVVCVDGPPGTGKTHSVVNCAATAVSLGRKTLVSSQNERALRCFVEKLPVELEPLCFDFSCCESGDMTKLQNSIDSVQGYMNESHDQHQRRISGISADTKLLKAKKKDLKALEASLAQASNTARKFFQGGTQVTYVFKLALLAGETAVPWLCESDDDETKTMDMSSILSALEKNILNDCNGGDVECVPKSVGDGSGELDNTKPSRDDKNWNKSSIGLSQSNASNVKQHGVVSQPFQTKYFCKAHLARKGLENDAYDDFGDISKDFVMKLRKGKEMKQIFDTLNKSEQKDLKDFLEGFLSSPVTRSSQDRFRALTLEIRTLEAKLVLTRTIVELKKTLSQEDRSKLEELSQLLCRVTCATFAISKSTDGERMIRHRDQVKKTVHAVVKCFPIVVMSADQVGSYIPPGHTFGLGILDEASQSDCTAINIMARCDQMLVVGDDQQVSPTHVFLPEKRVKELALIAPNIPSRNNLSPEASFFDLIKTAFPSYSSLLNEHYRCVPQIIQISDTACYNDRLKPVRSQPGESAIVDIFLEITGIPGSGEKKINIREAETIADLVFEIVDKAATLGPSSVETIGIISLGGEEQCKLMKDLVNKRLEPLRSIHGASVVDRHKILYGIPEQFQGDERDVVFLSLVHCPKNGKVHHLIDHCYNKRWNVAMTRAKNKLVVVRSYGIAHLKNEADVRRKFLILLSDKRWKFEGVQRKMDERVASKFDSEDKFILHLQGSGYVVRRNGGPFWSNALHVSVPGEGVSSNALLLIENSGESEEQWTKAVNEHISLESAGRACLRVDFVSLTLCFKSVLAEALEFLRTDGEMPVPLGMATGAKNSTRRVCIGSTSPSPTGPTDDATDAKRKASTSYTSEAKRTRVETESAIGRTNGGVESEDSDGSVDAANSKNDTRTLNGRKARRGTEVQNLGEAVEANGSADSRKNRDHLARGVKRTKSGNAGVAVKRKPKLGELLESSNESPDDDQPGHRTAGQVETMVDPRQIAVPPRRTSKRTRT